MSILRSPDAATPAGSASPDAATPTGSASPAGPAPQAGATPIRQAPERRADGGSSAPWLLQAAAGWSWRILVVAAAIYLLVLAVSQLRVMALALVAALLLSALVYPAFTRLRRLGLGRAAAAATTVIGLILGFLLVAAGLSTSTIAQWPELRTSLSEGIGEVRNWLVTGPLNLDQARVDNFNDTLSQQVSANRSRLTTGAVSGATLLAEVVTGLLLALFATFFFLADGPRIWQWFVRKFSPQSRPRVDGAGAVAWQTLTGYIRGTIFVAVVDAVLIGLGLLVVGVPLVAPLAVLTFLGAFIPIAGATFAGIAAVLVALVSKGPVAALIIAGVVLAVQQLEGNVLAPLVLGKSVALHPLAIVLAITAGGTLAGVAGSVVAVPLVAVLNRVAVYLARLRDTGGDLEHAAADEDPGALADATREDGRGVHSR